MVSARRVGTACPRLELKFLPVTVAEWEVVPRKPEPVSVTVHYRGEVEMAGNAEYKVLQVSILRRPRLPRCTLQYSAHQQCRPRLLWPC